MKPPKTWWVCDPLPFFSSRINPREDVVEYLERACKHKCVLVYYEGQWVKLGVGKKKPEILKTPPSFSPWRYMLTNILGLGSQDSSHNHSNIIIIFDYWTFQIHGTPSYYSGSFPQDFDPWLLGLVQRAVVRSSTDVRQLGLSRSSSSQKCWMGLRSGRSSSSKPN